MILPDDLREYYFSAPGDDVALGTLEFRHPAFFADDGITPMAARFVNDPSDFAATLEGDAPMNAGEVVTFTAGIFEATLPESADNGLPNFTLSVSNVSRELMPWMQKALSVGAPIELSYRQYLASDPTTPQIIMHGLTVKKASAGLLRVTATAGFEDFLNKPFPFAIYTSKKFPGLVR